MENKDDIQQKYIELESDIQLYKQEIKFLLKVLAREYTISITHLGIVKLLDAYWKEFEKSIEKLKNLETEIKKSKQETIFLCKHEINLLLPNLDEKKIFTEYRTIVNSLMNIKKNLYNYIESDERHKVALSVSSFIQ
jgi:hypothetical protein